MLRTNISTILLAAILCLSHLQAAPISRTSRQTPPAANTGSSDRVPQLLLDIYDCWSSGNLDCLPIADPDVNVVRTLMGHGVANPPQAVEASDPDSDRLFDTAITFTIPSSKDTLHAAFLHVYRKALSPSEVDSLKSDCPDHDLSNLELELYSSEVEESKDIVRMEESVSLDVLEKAEWLRFNNTIRLLQNTTSNVLRLRLAIGGSCSAISPAKFGLSFDQPGNEPVITVYAKKEEEDELLPKLMEEVRRRRRQTETGSGAGDSVPQLESKKPTTITEYQLTKCQIHDFNISFADTTFGSLILRPKTYNARLCAGNCEWPIGPEQNPSRHAYIQSIINDRHKNALPPPCCAPIPADLGRLPVVVRDSENNWSTQWWPNMIANSCGCL